MNEQAVEAIKHIADKLDIPVEQLWAGLVAYAPFTFYQWVAGIVIGLVVGGVLVAIAVKFNSKNLGDGFPAFACFMLGGMCLSGALFIGLMEMPDALAAKNAPQAWAAKQILRTIGVR